MIINALKNLMVTLHSSLLCLRLKIKGWRYPLTGYTLSHQTFSRNSEIAEHVVFNTIKHHPVMSLCRRLGKPLVLVTNVNHGIMQITAFRLMPYQGEQDMVKATKEMPGHDGIFHFISNDQILYRAKRETTILRQMGYIPAEPVFCFSLRYDNRTNQHLAELSDRVDLLEIDTQDVIVKGAI